MRQHLDGTFTFSPTDLVNFLGCHHASALDLRAFSEALDQDEVSEGDQLIRQKGLAHEAAYLQALKDQGQEVREISTRAPFPERLLLTREAIRSGVAVIYQAALAHGAWAGYADFLIRTPSPSSPGGFSYEVEDTKLARNAEPGHLIQLCVYSDLLAHALGAAPMQAHLVLGDGRRVSFRVDDYAYYVRHAMRRLERFAGAPPDTCPQPCAHCSHCHWQETCTAQWEKDDHLSQVANLQHAQQVRLESAGITTLAALGALPEGSRVPGVKPQVLERLRPQAFLQEHKRRTGENRVELIPCEPGRGFYRMPQPDRGDLFFDMEGDPLHPGGLEYLFGLSFLQDGRLTYRAFWAHDQAQEQAAFAQLMAFLHAHLETHPGAYIYHYNHYEPTALKRLAGRYAIAEHQLDDLLRGQRFVDLYRVVREAIRVSEPSYSLKNLETFYMPPRDGAVANAGDSILVYNRWRETGEEQLLREIAVYNETDCASTAGLRDWLLTLRPPQITWFGGTLPAADAETAAESLAKRKEHEERYALYQQRLQAAALEGQTDPRWRLANLLGYHQREARPQWWDFFDRKERLEDELLEDAECLGGLTLLGPPEPVKRSLVYAYRYPPQEHKRRAGESVCDVATLTSAGTIAELDENNGTVKIKRGSNLGPLPETLSIGPGKPIKTDVLREALYRVADDVLAGSGSYPALVDILSKASPRLCGRPPGDPILQGDDVLAGCVEAVAALDRSYVFIQGPPGSGKTHTSAHVIVELLRRGRKIGVTGNSHKVIHNLLHKIEELALGQGVQFIGIKKSSGDDSDYDGGLFIHNESRNDRIDPDTPLLAGTAWLFADERFDSSRDYLVIDEAGQVPVANVIAAGTAARNVILVGDQMQLGQPVQGVHPGEAGLSILDFLLGDQATVAPERGIFLDRTRRLRPEICRFISDAFYDGRLTPDPRNSARRLRFGEPIGGISCEGIFFLPVDHSGCSQKCLEEGEAVRQYFELLLGQHFDDGTGRVRRLTVDDILVVSPYNVQVLHLTSILPAGARVGTVDKFQGQEAPAVIVSMATSAAEDMPRNIEFLFSPNRLNVALSRAQCLALVVASPRLLETPCRSIEQMRLANKFCQLAVYASWLPR
jgi:uncharacterized protein